MVARPGSWCCTLLAAIAQAWWPSPASAQAYPTRAIRLMVPFPPAEATDILSRELAKQPKGSRLIRERRITAV